MPTCSWSDRFRRNGRPAPRPPSVRGTSAVTGRPLAWLGGHFSWRPPPVQRGRSADRVWGSSVHGIGRMDGRRWSTCFHMVAVTFPTSGHVVARVISAGLRATVRSRHVVGSSARTCSIRIGLRASPALGSGLASFEHRWTPRSPDVGSLPRRPGREGRPPRAPPCTWSIHQPAYPCPLLTSNVMDLFFGGRAFMQIIHRTTSIT